MSGKVLFLMGCFHRIVSGVRLNAILSTGWYIAAFRSLCSAGRGRMKNSRDRENHFPELWNKKHDRFHRTLPANKITTFVR